MSANSQGSSASKQNHSEGAFLSWRANPLLFHFVRGTAGGAQRWQVPAADRSSWSERLSTLGLELRHRHDVCREAVLAHLMLALVGVGRLAANLVGDLRFKDNPLLAKDFGFIEERYRERVSHKGRSGDGMAVARLPHHARQA